MSLHGHSIASTSVVDIRASLGIGQSVGLDRCVKTCTPHYSVTQSSFTSLNSLCAPLLHSPHYFVFMDKAMRHSHLKCLEGRYHSVSCGVFYEPFFPFSSPKSSLSNRNRIPKSKTSETPFNAMFDVAQYTQNVSIAACHQCKGVSGHLPFFLSYKAFEIWCVFHTHRFLHLRMSHIPRTQCHVTVGG